jgi:hypothetical protein
VQGRLAPVIELGVGFHPLLNAFDNVTVAATLMGLRPAEARRRFPEVIGFAELEEFVDMKLANYSSGMQARLGFATAIQVDAEVFLFDEVLAVGDALFQRKCFDTFERLVSGGHCEVGKAAILTADVAATLHSRGSRRGAKPRRALIACPTRRSPSARCSPPRRRAALPRRGADLCWSWSSTPSLPLGGRTEGRERDQARE